MTSQYKLFVLLLGLFLLGFIQGEMVIDHAGSFSNYACIK